VSRTSARTTGRPPRVCFIVSDSLSMVLLGRLPGRLMSAGAEVFVITSPGARLVDAADDQGFTAIELPMRRKMAPGHDVVSLARLWRALRRIRPDLVDASTPKAGFLGMIAARLARVPLEIYTLRGLRLDTESGAMRQVLRVTERTSAGLADEVLVVSPSLRERAIELGIAPAAKLTVLGPGSLRGVDLERFAPTPAVLADADRHRSDLGIAGRDPVMGFVGRLSRSKGITELLDACALVRRDRPAAHLVIVGDVDDSEPINAVDQDRLAHTPGIHLVPWTTDLPGWLATMDFVVFPSKREGFPNVPLEAAGLHKPCIAFRVTGTVDAVVDGETGVLVAPGDVVALAAAMTRYIDNPEQARRDGKAAYERARADFTSAVAQARHVAFLLGHLDPANAG
jgi:glycosyltransferase involved in cell wall biosynthesis